jgi:hypothetical protein
MSLRFYDAQIAPGPGPTITSAMPLHIVGAPPLQLPAMYDTEAKWALEVASAPKNPLTG